ncbi:hypothetical protein LDO26_16795 [Luteimonas sp. BDR2-5]|uniref:hypothetical protein n=1 Tax=Proluteimonas luteida TaxID=2878685 RepID=UPI001E4E7B3E|nr:hypothetical protein [Luteimonas sp. BDR2-5]MCD9029850.1 hypothetical protein [Luteimonas sp. BDR2-5]
MLRRGRERRERPGAGRRPGAGLVALLALCGVAGSVHAAQDDPAFLGGFLRETRIVYPLSVGDWHAVGEHRFDQPELGVSVRYVDPARPDHALDVYFYPAGQIGPAQLDRHMQQSVAELKAIAGHPGYYRAIAFSPVRRQRVALPGVEPEAVDGELRSVDALMAQPQGDYHSAMVIAAARLYFVKARYSVPAAAMRQAQARTSLEAFVVRLLPQTLIASTGDCAAPLPVELLPQDQALPETDLLQIHGDDVAGAVLTADFRVVARAGDADSARLLAALGTALRDSRFPGCVGESPVNPEVPDGSREIRLEYRDGRVRGRPATGGRARAEV